MRRLGLVLLLVAAACTGNGTDATGPTTTTAAPLAEPATTSTSITVAPTTTEVSGPQVINLGTRFVPGSAYRGRLPVAGIEFELEFQTDGWKVLHIPGNARNYVALKKDALPASTGATVIAWRADQTLAEVAAWYRSHELVDQATEPQPVTVAGNDALRFDLLMSLRPNAPHPCWGLPLVADGDGFDGGSIHHENLQACTWIRMWVIQVDQFAVSANVRAAVWNDLTADEDTQLDPDNVWQIEDFQPHLDDFINGLSFCTTATPCDN